MATDKGPVAAESASYSAAPSQPPPAHSPVSVEALTAEAARATQSLKRHREATPTSPGSATHPHFSAEMSPSKAARIVGLSSRHSPIPPMTGAAAAEDERRRRQDYERHQQHLQPSGASENPAYKVQSELLSPRSMGMSRPHDAPSHLPEIPPPETAPEPTRPAAHPSPPPAASATSTAAAAAEPAVEAEPTFEAAHATEPPTEHSLEDQGVMGQPAPEVVPQEVDHQAAHDAVQAAAREATDEVSQATHEIPQEANHEEHRHDAQEHHQEHPQEASHALPEVSQSAPENEAQHLPPSPQTEAAAPASMNGQDSLPASTSTIGEADHRNGANASETATSMSSVAGEAPPVTASPGPMDVDGRGPRTDLEGGHPPDQMEEKGGVSLSYPPMSQTSPNMPAPAVPDRGMSLPMTQGGPRSPNSKRHRCPFCESEFTRHHNLKSHLLTHSQDKPFICETCNMRFRRLHDLKRHSKLHTGEKPHICPKCDRKFARGDALARHSKGPGGCVGRRTSMGGSFIADEDPEGSSHLGGNVPILPDLSYEAHSDDADMPDEERRRLGVKPQHIQGSGTSLTVGHGNSALYNQSGVTESPKPVSPGMQAHDAANAHRQRSPSLATQLQHQHFSRQQSEPQTSPVSNSYTTTAVDAARYAAAAAGTSPAAAHHAQVQHESIESAGHGNNSEGQSNNMLATDQVWVYVHSLEDQVRGLNQRVHTLETSERQREDQIGTLYGELMGLRSQVGAILKQGHVEADAHVPEAVASPAASVEVAAEEPMEDVPPEVPADMQPEAPVEEPTDETAQGEPKHDYEMAPAPPGPPDLPAIASAAAPEPTSAHVEMVDS